MTGLQKVVPMHGHVMRPYHAFEKLCIKDMLCARTIGHGKLLHGFLLARLKTSLQMIYTMT